MKLELKENKGISLVTLVVTIVVILILAVVSITLTVGENRNNNQSNTSEVYSGDVRSKGKSRNKKSSP